LNIEEWHRELSARRCCIMDLNFDINRWIKRIQGDQNGYSMEELHNEEPYTLTTEDMEESLNDGDIDQDEYEESIARIKKEEEDKQEGRNTWDYAIRTMVNKEKKITISDYEVRFMKDNPSVRAVNVNDIFKTHQHLKRYDDVNMLLEEYEFYEGRLEEEYPLWVNLTMGGHSRPHRKQSSDISTDTLEKIFKDAPQSNCPLEQLEENFLSQEDVHERRFVREICRKPISEILQMEPIDMVAVNIESPDDVIIKNFKEWLKTKREEVTRERHKTYVKNHKRNSGVRLQKKPNENNTAYWHKNKVLPYIDLRILMMLSGLEQMHKLHDKYRAGGIENEGILRIADNIIKNIHTRNHALYAQILFSPDSIYGEGDKDTVRRDIAPLADMLLYSHIGRSLIRSNQSE